MSAMTAAAAANLTNSLDTYPPLSHIIARHSTSLPVPLFTGSVPAAGRRRANTGPVRD
jgi:hypothetical protein